jgi:hypothetical protein
VSCDTAVVGKLRCVLKTKGNKKEEKEGKNRGHNKKLRKRGKGWDRERNCKVRTNK